MRYLWIRAELRFFYRKEIILIEPEKDSVSLLSQEERNLFIKLLKIYAGDPAELAGAVCEDRKNRTNRTEI